MMLLIAPKVSKNRKKKTKKRSLVTCTYIQHQPAAASSVVCYPYSHCCLFALAIYLPGTADPHTYMRIMCSTEIFTTPVQQIIRKTYEVNNEHGVKLWTVPAAGCRCCFGSLSGEFGSICRSLFTLWLLCLFVVCTFTLFLRGSRKALRVHERHDVDVGRYTYIHTWKVNVHIHIYIYIYVHESKSGDDVYYTAVIGRYLR